MKISEEHQQMREEIKEGLKKKSKKLKKIHKLLETSYEGGTDETDTDSSKDYKIRLEIVQEEE